MPRRERPPRPLAPPPAARPPRSARTHLLRRHVVRRNPDQILVRVVLGRVERQRRLPRHDRHAPLHRLKAPRQRIGRGGLEAHGNRPPLRLLRRVQPAGLEARRVRHRRARVPRRRTERAVRRHGGVRDPADERERADRVQHERAVALGALGVQAVAGRAGLLCARGAGCWGGREGAAERLWRRGLAHGARGGAGAQEAEGHGDEERDEMRRKMRLGEVFRPGRCGGTPNLGWRSAADLRSHWRRGSRVDQTNLNLPVCDWNRCRGRALAFGVSSAEINKMGRYQLPYRDFRTMPQCLCCPTAPTARLSKNAEI
jgi:hypothetical protein